MEAVREFLRRPLDRILEPIAMGLVRRRVSPNVVSIAGTLINVGAAGLLVAGLLPAAGVVYLIAGCADLLDGQVARLSNRAGAAGAFLDSTLDRISEGVVITAVAYHFAVSGAPIASAIAVLALLASLLVSYTRARGEALGVDCRIGLITRAERVVLVAAGLVFGVLAPAVSVLLVLAACTVAQRIGYIHRELRRDE